MASPYRSVDSAGNECDVIYRGVTVRPTGAYTADTTAFVAAMATAEQKVKKFAKTANPNRPAVAPWWKRFDRRGKR